MERPGSGLADRLKAMMDSMEVDVARAAETRERRRIEGRAARSQLLDDLEAFARAVGHFDVNRHGESLTIEYGGALLLLEEMGDGDRVRVQFDAAEARREQHRIYREQALADRWVWSVGRAGGEDRLPLFDRGLGQLLVRALGVPGLEEEAEAPMSARLARALVAPDTSAPLEVLDGGLAGADLAPPVSATPVDEEGVGEGAPSADGPDDDDPSDPPAGGLTVLGEERKRTL
jgi:hypothetical protein